MIIKPNLYQVVAVTYICFCVFYFLPLQVPCKIIIPLLLLLLFAKALIRNNTFVMALFFSMLGDLMGALHSLEFQLSSFALAHVCFISYFYAITRKTAVSFTKSDFWKVALLVILYILVCSVILPHVNDGVLFFGVIIYAFLILSMLFMTLKVAHLLSIAGALFFVISDFILGYYLFVGHVPYSVYFIMIPYYLAQLLLFSDAVEK